MDDRAVGLWAVETLRSLPPESMPWSTGVEFHGGCLTAGSSSLPMMSDVFGPIPFGGYERGRPESHWYELTGWRPDPGVWVYTLDQKR